MLQELESGEKDMKGTLPTDTIINRVLTAGPLKNKDRKDDAPLLRQLLIVSVGRLAGSKRLKDMAGQVSLLPFT